MSYKWGQMRQRGEDELDSMVETEDLEVIDDVTVKTRVKQLKESSSRTFASMKKQISVIYR